VLEKTVAERTAELRESEARFRRLTELASDWYWERDEAGNFTQVFGPVMEMLGLPNDTLPDQTSEAQAARWNEAERLALDANMAARRPFLDFVYSRINADGTRQYFQVSGEPMFDNTGRFTGYRGVGKEVTDMLHGELPSKRH